MSLGLPLVIYSLLLVAMGLAGGILPQILKMTHARMQMVISFVGGLMLGIGILHLLPHAFVQLNSIDQTALGVILGLTAMFIFLRWFHFHEHELPETVEPVPNNLVPLSVHHHDHDHDAGHHHDHDHDHSQDTPGHCHHPRHRPTWAMIFSGLAIHTLLDGMALGANIKTDLAHNHLLLPGFGAYLAIIMHKPLDTLTISSMMMRENVGWKTRALWIIGYCLVCPLGALLFLAGISQLGDMQKEILGMVLAFSSGVFICIALSDLLPEIEFHSHDRVKLTTLLLAGIGLAYAISWAEPSHQHRITPDRIDIFIPPK